MRHVSTSRKAYAFKALVAPFLFICFFSSSSYAISYKNETCFDIEYVDKMYDISNHVVAAKLIEKNAPKRIYEVIKEWKGKLSTGKLVLTAPPNFQVERSEALSDIFIFFIASEDKGEIEFIDWCRPKRYISKIDGSDAPWLVKRLSGLQHNTPEENKLNLDSIIDGD